MNATTISDIANILVVDDLPENQLVYRTVLEELGQNLILARSGAEALRQVLEHEFAVILLDVNMPNMSGLETAAFIRQRKKAAHTPIIFITAYADEMQTAEGGMDGYEVARRLRTQPHMDKTVLVAMTGYGHQRDHLQAKAAGFDHYLVKPVDPEALQRVLASLGER